MPSDILSTIIARKRKDLEIRKRNTSLVALKEKIQQAQAAPQLVSSIRLQMQKQRAAVIAEVKKASPSKGVIRPKFSPKEIALAYKSAGATALSVLTEREFFLGADEYLIEAKATSGLPVLRKDFVVDPYQVFETKVLGADALLLIVAALPIEALKDLYQLAKEIGLDVLVEVHTASELEQALELKPDLLGINNRNLKTFNTDIGTTLELCQHLPKETIVVSESGLHDSKTIKHLMDAGVYSFLVGEAFMRHKSPGDAFSEMFAGLV